MSDPADTLLSVRGEARQVVPPDYVTMTARIEVTRGSKAEAVRTAAANLESLIAELAARGGVSLEVGTERRPLTWSAQARPPNELATACGQLLPPRWGDALIQANCGRNLASVRL